MPIRPENRKRYPPEWPRISFRIRFERARGHCEICGIARHGYPHPITGSIVVLTVMHLNHRPEDNSYNNLRAGCQRCHNRYDQPHRVRNRRNREMGMNDLFEDS